MDYMLLELAGNEICEETARFLGPSSMAHTSLPSSSQVAPPTQDGMD